MTLLRRLLPSQDLDALLDDIVEESRRRSWLWYWSQLLAVLAGASWKETRTHWVLALRALAVGVALFPAAGLLHLRDRLAYVQVVLIYGLSNRPHYWLGVLGPHTVVFSTAFSVVLFVATGWAIVRLHRAHGIALVMLCTTVMAALTLTEFLGQALQMPALMPRAAFYLLLIGAKCVSFPVSILLGGYLATRPTERA